MPVAVSHLAKVNGRALPTCWLPLPQRLLAEDTFQFLTLKPKNQVRGLQTVRHGGTEIQRGHARCGGR